MILVWIGSVLLATSFVFSVLISIPYLEYVSSRCFTKISLPASHSIIVIYKLKIFIAAFTDSDCTRVIFRRLHHYTLQKNIEKFWRKEMALMDPNSYMKQSQCKTINYSDYYNVNVREYLIYSGHHNLNVR